VTTSLRTLPCSMAVFYIKIPAIAYPHATLLDNLHLAKHFRIVGPRPRNVAEMVGPGRYKSR
jgi:hypothetical protein